MSRPTTEPLASVTAEQAMLGAMLYKPSDALIAAVGLRSADFSTVAHQRIFEAVLALDADGEAIDPVVVVDRLRRAGKLESAGGDQYLAELCRESSGAANAAAYVKIIRDFAIRRHALHKPAEARDKIIEGTGAASDITTDLASSVAEWSTETRNEPQSMSTVMTSALDAAKRAHDRREAGGVVGAPFGIPALDNRIGGLHGPRFVIIAGRPGVGKTALAQQLMLNAASKGFAIGLISLEMSAEETGMRALACRLGLNAAALARGDKEEFESLKTATMSESMRLLRGLPIYADFESFSLGGIIARISQLRSTEKINLAIVDHIGLIEADGFSTRNDQLGHISRSFKKLAKRLGIPIVALSQLNRTVERENRRPRLSDLRDSGNIEQDADSVIALHAADDFDGPRMSVEIGLLKLRDGVKGWLPQQFQFDGRAQRFHELSPISGENTDRPPPKRFARNSN